LMTLVASLNIRPNVIPIRTPSNNEKLKPHTCYV
jgi:hypothetical protein